MLARCGSRIEASTCRHGIVQRSRKRRTSGDRPPAAAHAAPSAGRSCRMGKKHPEAAGQFMPSTRGSKKETFLCPESYKRHLHRLSQRWCTGRLSSQVERPMGFQRATPFGRRRHPPPRNRARSQGHLVPPSATHRRRRSVLEAVPIVDDALGLAATAGQGGRRQDFHPTAHEQVLAQLDGDGF